ncbi:MAG: HU family DNA-binding protein [Corallococcus sp.]|nr:HU family DNA-binding protein [Corallococcus sp.]
MKKGQFIKELQDKTGKSASETNKMFDAFWDCVGEQLKKGEDVALTGIGTFRIKKTSKRKGVNPATGEKITIPAKTVVAFKPSKSFYDSYM